MVKKNEPFTEITETINALQTIINCYGFSNSSVFLHYIRFKDGIEA